MIFANSPFNVCDTLPKAGSMFWYKDWFPHRDEKDPKTGLTLPAEIWGDGSKEWYKNGKRHRDDIDSETGFTLPTIY